ncbi:porin [Polynucleobacter sp. 71A-WALBACH]|uniref:porin n=1 Tax=Polynucleobacter sp. 71A-WALBACH TaxID=2689097 RepID=UPI001C0CCF19|nr:porin [Polynucleobacter sp. 71A-WALBACH]MBU3593070.1 porin [Polynucleobacter sp. 71A-WALBACH]
MKKSLFAVAAVTAFAGAAQAQSSVTVYGLLDVGYIGGNSRLTNNSSVPVSRTTTNQFGQSAESTSRLGFKGVEDLGNGTSAFFTAEFALYPQDTNTSGNSNAGLLNRQTFVGLKKNGIGQTALGLQQTGIFNAVAVTDPGQMNNVVGNVVYSSYAGGTSNSDSGANSIGFTNRISNVITFKTDNFAGFTANALYSLNNKNQNQVTTTTVTSGGNTNAGGWGIGADYTIQKFYINAQYQALKQLTTATDLGTAAQGNTAIWTQPQANGATTASTVTGQAVTGAIGNNVQDNQFYAGATYDFGILKAYAQYLNRKATSTVSSSYFVKRQAEQIGVRSFITPTIEAWASAGLGRYTAFGQNNGAVNFNAWQLGSNYYLSKRTNLYAIYGQTLSSTGSYITVSGTTVGNNSSGASNYAIGVRHTF